MRFRKLGLSNRGPTSYLSLFFSVYSLTVMSYTVCNNCPIRLLTEENCSIPKKWKCEKSDFKKVLWVEWISVSIFFDSWEQSVNQSGRTPNQTVGDLGYLTLVCQLWENPTLLYKIGYKCFQKRGFEKGNFLVQNDAQKS